jgi:uncharacterized protein
MQIPTAYVSRPRVLVNGHINNALSDDVLSVLIEETIEGLYRCEVRFNNYGVDQSGRGQYLYFGRDILDFGTDFAVHIGAGNQAGQVFRGRISAIEAEYPSDGGGLITVLAEDRLQDLRMSRRTRTFEEVSDEDVIRQIATEHSLTAIVSVSGPTHKVLAQVNQSDLAFMRERARSLGAELWVEDKTLFARSRTDRGDRTVVLTYGRNLLSFSVRADLAHQCTELGITSWDVAAKDGIEEIATENAIHAELGLRRGDTAGSSILQQAFGERKERIVHTVPLTGEEARSIAQARYREQARRFVTGSGIADGDARIRVGCIVYLLGLGRLFNGNYYVVRVRHSYDSLYGFRTTFDVERPGLGYS